MAEDSSGNVGSVLLAFTVGAVLGAATALLFAPRSGRETRDFLADKGRDLADKARGVSADAKAYVQGKKEDISAAVQAGREAMRHERAHTESEV